MDPPRTPPRWHYLVPATLAAVFTLVLFVDAPPVALAALAALTLGATQWCVAQCGGWRLIGPHSYYDLLRISRKGSVVLLRMLFLAALLTGLWFTYRGFAREAWANRAVERNELARFNSKCVSTWFFVQNIAILVLTPAYMGGAIAEERERGTLELLLATGLNNREIVLGKLVARLVHLGAFLLAGLPVFSIMLVWGGIDLQLLLACWINSTLLLLAAGAVSLMFSTMPLRSTATITISYAVVLPCGAFAMCAWQLQGASLEDFVCTGVGYAFAIPFCLLVAILAVRQPDTQPNTGLLESWMPEYTVLQVSEPDAKEGAFVGAVSIAKVPTTTRRHSLPPVADEALLWKERYTGGRSVLLIPEVQGFVLMTGAILMCIVITAAREVPHGAIVEDLQTCFQAGYAIALVSYCIGVAFRAATCVVRERQAQTLDLLLQVPVERREILRAKWRGALLKGWPWLVFVVADLGLGFVCTAYHPYSVVFMLLCPLPLIYALCSVGVLISTLARTTVQANLAMACTLLVLATYGGTRDPGLYVGFSPFTYTWWQEPDIERDDVIASLFSAAMLVAVGVAARLLAGDRFERLGRS